ncbi:MAG: metallophosphoesterase [Bacteroidales bacterium]
MFLFLFLLGYFIPHAYLFFRIRKHFINSAYWLVFLMAYLTLAILLPVIAIGFYNSNSFLGDILIDSTGYLMALYFYLFFMVLLFDLFLLFNHFTRFIKTDTIKNFRFKWFTFSGMLLISIVTIIYGVVNLNNLKVSAYDIEIPCKNSKLTRLKIVFAADFHIDGNRSLNYVKKFVQMSNQLHPDIVLLGGDIIEGSQENEAIEKEFRQLNPPMRTYSVLGNHEFYAGKEDGIFFKNSGILLLNDTLLLIDSSFYLAGRYDEHFKSRKSLSNLIKNYKDGLPLILLAHRPLHLDETAKTPVNIQFSGHTHNGQLFPVNFIINQIYELAWGHRKIGNTHFFVTSGLHLWGPPVKTIGKSEIMLVNVVFR